MSLLLFSMILKPFFLGLLSWGSILLALPAFGETSQAVQIDHGRLIYLEGKLPSGNPIIGIRQDIELRGEQAACVHCHRESGLGGTEGIEIISPISGPALFGEKGAVIVEHLRRFNRSLSAAHLPYDHNTFATAVRSGENISGGKLNTLMPRYQFTDSEIDDLMAYLRTLSTNKSPAVNNKEIHIASVITPDVSEANKKAFIETIQAMVSLHNVNVVSGLRQKISPIERKMQNRRKWRLDIWDLNGPSDTWQAQLSSLQKNDPAFAILSGLSDNAWQPVQNFCEEKQVACWFPSIETPPSNADKSKYSLYFNQGAILDANVISHQLMKQASGRVIQIDDGSIAAQVAKETLHHQMALQHTNTQDFSWDLANPNAVSNTIKNLRPEDTLVLWLHREALNHFTTHFNAPTSSIYYSALLSGNDLTNLNENWTNNSWTVSEIEQPNLRSANLKRFRDWMSYYQIPIADEKMQSEVYFAVNSFDWMVSSLLNNFYPRYLVERAESYLSMYESMQVQDEVQALMMGGESKRPPQNNNANDQLPIAHNVVNRDLLFKRESTSIYPRLSLGIGQRFASKGAYLIKAKASSSVDAQWIVP